MGALLPRPAALNTRLETSIEEWPYLDEAVLLKTRSRKACMTCHWFRHHAGRADSKSVTGVLAGAVSMG